jgi:hypothetical protein
MVKLFFCSGGVVGNIATRSSSSAHIAIGAIAIAARSAGSNRAFGKGEARIDGTNGVKKAGLIIATGRMRIDNGSGPHWLA